MIQVSRLPAFSIATTAALGGFLLFGTGILMDGGKSTFQRDALVSFSLFFVYLTMALIASMILFRSLSFKLVSWSFASASVTSTLDFIPGIAHSAMSSVGIYGFFGIGPSSNEQWATVFVYIFLMLALSARVITSRSFDRVAFLVVGTSVLFTGSLFHYQAASSLMLSKSEEINFVKAISEYNSPDLCITLGMNCQFIGKDSVVDDELIGETIKSMSPFIFEKPESKFLYSWHGTSSGGNFGSSSFVASVSRKAGDQDALLTTSTLRLNERLRFEEIRLAISSIFAHSIWVIGGIFVCSVHNMRRRAWRMMLGIEQKN